MTASAILAPVKTCTKCGQCKPESKFTIKTYASGNTVRINTCNQCRAVANKNVLLRDPKSLAAHERQLKRKDLKESGLKACRTCAATKVLSEFRSKSKENCYTADCKTCAAAAGRDHYHANKEDYAARSKKYREKNLSSISEKKREYVLLNRKATTDRQAQWAREKRKSDPLFAMKSRIRSMLSDCFRLGGYTKKARAMQILGCDWDALKVHMERQFIKGMTWGNRGLWEIDHIVPLASAQTEEDIFSLNHFTNLRPMWADANNLKGAQVTHLI